MLQMSEINEMDEKTILKKVDALRKELFSLRMTKHTGGLDKHNIYKITQRDIARLLTALSSKSRKA